MTPKDMPPLEWWKHMLVAIEDYGDKLWDENKDRLRMTTFVLMRKYWSVSHIGDYCERRVSLLHKNKNDSTVG